MSSSKNVDLYRDFAAGVYQSLYTDKKKIKFFLMYKKIQSGTVIYEEGLPNI